MNRGRTLVMTSLLAILFFSIHLADDIVRGFEEGNLSNLPAFAILVVWLYGTVVLGDRRSGHVIMLLGALLGCGVPVIHMAGIGIGVDGSNASYRTPPPRLGEHTDEVLRNLLGYDQETIAGLRTAKVV